MSASLRRTGRDLDRPPSEGAGPRHFLDLRDFDPATLRQMLELSAQYKKAQGVPARPLIGKMIALIFEKPSTRTRVSFEVGIRQLGGEAIVLNGADMQTSRGESPADTARVLSRYVDAILMRTAQVSKLHEMARYATVPVINGLTDTSHPCQLMADVLTFEEHRGPIAGQVVAWCGDGNNVARSWIEAAVRFGFTLRLATPDALRPPQDLIDWARAQGGTIELTDDPAAAVKDARCVVTDTWVSMSDDPNSNRHNMLAPYRVTSELMATYASPVNVGTIPSLERSHALHRDRLAGRARHAAHYYLLQGEKYDSYRKAYRAYIQQMLELGKIANAAGKADAIFALETAMAKDQWSPEKERDIAALNDPEDVAGLEGKAPENSIGR